jgi:lactoylglutathione lyase
MMADMDTQTFNPEQWVWGTADDRPRFLHTMIRVRDFDASLSFYIDGLGMRVWNRFDIAARRVSAIFIGFEDYAAGGLLELTRRWGDQGDHTHGTGYGHIAVGAPDIDAAVARLEAMGVTVDVRPTIYMPGGPAVAFVRDPDGYAVELIQTSRN